MRKLSKELKYPSFVECCLLVKITHWIFTCRLVTTENEQLVAGL